MLIRCANTNYRRPLVNVEIATVQTTGTEVACNELDARYLQFTAENPYSNNIPNSSSIYQRNVVVLLKSRCVLIRFIDYILYLLSY